jgi:GR25 family glycosyltransferase involved in LPS biosynthesis
MSFINSIVNQVFVINMDKDIERLEKITAVLSKQNITFERIPGVPGKDVKYDDRLTDFCNNFCGDSVKGCALSHRNIWDIAHERGYETILVFEDDADIPSDLSVQLQNIWETRPRDYDIISLGIECFGKENNTVCSHLQDLMGFSPKQFNKQFLKVSGQFDGHALIISRKGIEKLRTHKINGHVDVNITIWANLYNYNLYTTNTFTINQQDDVFESNNSVPIIYPYGLNYIFKHISMTHIRRVDYSANLSIFKLGSLNITLSILCIFFITLFVKPIYKYIILTYLIIEFFVTPIVSEAAPFFTVWTAAFLISYPFYGKNFKNMKRFSGKLIKAATR